jgi:restriction endonuclease S subunit
VKTEKINPYYLACVLKNEGEKQRFSRTLRASTNRIKNLDLAFPEKSEQDRIVAECETVDAECETARKSIEDNENKIMEAFNEAEKKNANTFKISDTAVFDVSIGKRVIETEVKQDGKIPIYSANVFEPFGYFDKLLLTDFSKPSVLWGIDGDWMVNLIPANQQFYPTDHCGILRVNTANINPRFLAYALKGEGIKQRFSRTLRASTDRIKSLTLTLPSITEQTRIVAEVEKLETEITAARAILSAAPARKHTILEKHLN